MADLQANKRAADKETNSNENSNESKPIPPPRNVTKKRNKMDYDSMTDSELSDWETRSFGHTNITSPPLIPRQSVESNSPHGSPNKRSYPPLFDTGLDSTNFSTDLFPKKKYTDRFNWSPDKENRFHGNWNNSISSHDSAIGGSLFSAFGSVLTDSSSSFESQVNSEESASNLSSPAHSVYGRYQKTLGEESKGTKAENDIETLVLHRLPGENLGMILGINGGRSKDAVSEVYVKTVTIGGAAYRATGGTKGIEVGDRILQINGTDINTLTHDECLSVLREMPLRVILQIRRNHNKKIPVVTSPAMSVRSQRSYASSQYGMNNDYSESSSYSESEDDGNFDGFNLIQVEIDKNPDESLGLSIVPSYGSTRHFYQIKRILPSGAAARCQQLKVGDRLVSCNGLSLRNVSQSQCLTTLKSEGNSGDLELEVLRQSEHESQLEISLKVSNRAGIAGGYDSTVTLRSPNSERHFFSEVPNSDSDNEVVLNKFQFIDDQNNYRQSEPYQYSKRGDRNESINRSLSSERDRDTDSEVAAITDKNKTSKMDPSDTYIPPPMEFSAFGPAVPPPEEFSQGQSPIFDQRGNSGMPVTNIDEILNSYSQTGMISTGPVDSAETNSSSFNPPIISDETEFVNNENGFQQSESFTGLEKDENDSLNNSIEINGDLNDSLNIAAPVEFSNQENINVSESYLRKEDQDENILKSDFSSQQQVSGTDYTMKDEICIKLNNSVVESVDEHSKDRDVWNNNTLNKQTKHISDPDSEELVVPVKVQRQNLQNSSILYSEDPEDVSMSSGDIEEDIIVPSVIKRQNLSESSVAVKKQKTDTEDEEKAVPIPRPRPQPRKGKSNVKSPTEKRQMDADLISHPKYPPPVQFENEAAVEEEVMTPILQPKQNVSKIIVEKVGPKIQEDTILPVEVKRGENSWNAAKMLVITNMWAKSASENQEKQNVQDVSSNFGFKDVIGLVSKAEQMEEPDLEEDDNVADDDSNTAAIEEVVVDVNLADDSDKTLKYIASDQDETAKHVTTVTVSHDLESDINQTNKDGDVIISDNEFKQVLEPQDTTQNDSEKTVGLNESLTVSVKNIGEESAPVQTIKSLENVDFSVKSVEKDEVDKNEVNQNIVQADGNRTVINLSPGSENSEMTNTKLNVQVSSASAKENKLPEKTTSNNVPENPPSITSPRQYKSSVSVTKPQSILGTIKSQNASSGLKPLSSIKPLTVSAKTFSLSKPVKYATTISTSSGKPSLLSTIHGSALLSTSSSAKNTRSEDEPFLVSVLKGILGLGMKVVVMPEGAVQVTEIQQNGPIAKDGNIRVGDYLLSINSTELTGLPDNKVQQMLRLLPRGIAKIMVSATGIKTTGEEDQTKANKPEEQKPQASKVDEKRSTQRTSLASMASPVVHSKRIPTTTSESSQSPVSSDVPQSQSLTSTPPLSSIKSSQDKHPEINESNDSKLVETVLESNIPKISQDFELKKDESVLEGNVVSSKKVPPKVAPKPKQRTSANETATHKFSSVKGQGGYVSSAVGRSKSFEKKNVPNVERDPPFQKQKANYVSSAQKISAPAEKDGQMDNGPIDTIIFASINDSKDKPVSASRLSSSNIENPNGPEPKLIPKGHVDYVTAAKPKQGPATAPKPKHFTSNPPLHKSKDIPISPYAYEETTKKVVPTRLNSALSPRRKSSDQGAFKFGANSSKSPSKGKNSASELDVSPAVSPRSISSPTSPTSPSGGSLSPSSPKTFVTSLSKSSSSPVASPTKKDLTSPIPSPRRISGDLSPALSPKVREDTTHFHENMPSSTPQDSQTHLDDPDTSPEMQLQTLQNNQDTSPLLSPQTNRDALDTSPITSLQTIQDAPDTSPIMPHQTNQDAPDTCPIMSPQTIQDAPDTSPIMSLQTNQDAPDTCPIMSPQTIQDAPVTSPIMSLQTNRDAPDTSPLLLPQTNQQNPNTSPEVQPAANYSDCPIKVDTASQISSVVDSHIFDVVNNDALTESKSVIDESNKDVIESAPCELELSEGNEEIDKKLINESDFNSLLNLEEFAEVIVKNAIQRGIDEFKDSEEDDGVDMEASDKEDDNNSANDLSRCSDTEGKRIDDIKALGSVYVHETEQQFAKPVMETKSLRAFLEKLDQPNSCGEKELPVPESSLSISDNPVATNIAMDMINDKHLEATTTINSDLEKPLQSGEVYTNTNTLEQNQGEDERIAKSKVEDGNREEKNELVFGDGLVNTNIQPQSTASVICMQASPDPTQSPNNACSGLDVVESPSVQGMHTDLQTNVKLDNLVMSDPFSMQESSLPEDSKNNRGDTLCDDEVNLNVVNSSEIVHCENVNVFNKFNQDSCTDTLTSDSNVGDQTVLDEEHSKGDNSNSENAEKFKLKEKSDNLGSDDNKMPPVHIDYSGIVSRRPWSLILGQQEVYVSSAPQNVCHLSDLNLSATSNTVSDQEVCVFLDKTNDSMDRLSLPVEDEIIVISLQRQSMDIPVGLTLKQGERGGILVSGILPGGLIPENGKIGINDHLHLVNGESVESKELNDVTESFDKLSADIILTISKNSTQERYPETTSVSQFEELIDIQNSQDEESSDDSPPALPGSPPPLPPKSDLPDVGIDMTNVTDNDRKSETDDVNPTEMPDKVIEIDTSLNKEIRFNENTPKIPDIIESALIHDTVDEKNKKVEDIGNTEDPNVISSSKEDSPEDTNLKSAEEFPEKYKTERNRDVEVNGKNDESPATSPAPVFENLELPASDDGGETKTHEVSMHKGVTGLGFLIEGGIASPRGDQPISIRRIFKGGPAEKCGHLKVKDVILCVNGVDISQMRHSEAWTHLKFLDDGEVKLLIQRKEENI